MRKRLSLIVAGLVALTAGCVSHVPPAQVGFQRLDKAVADPASAALAAAAQATQGMAQKDVRALLVFESLPESGAALVQRLRAGVGPDVPILGCSTCGQLTSLGIDRIVQGEKTEPSVSVCALAGPKLKVAWEYLPKTDTAALGSMLGELIKRTQAKAVFLFAAPDAVYGEAGVDLVKAFAAAEKAAGVAVPIVGGIAYASNKKDGKPVLYAGGSAYGGGVLAVALAGEIAVSYDSRHALRAVGPVFKVTQSDGGLVQELDGQRPTNLVDPIFKKESPKEKFKHMGIVCGDRLVCMGYGWYRHGYLAFSRAIPVGTQMQVIVGDTGQMDCVPTDGDGLAAVMAGKPAAVFVFSCGSRQPSSDKVRAAEEGVFRAAADAPQPGVPVFGFFGGGEIGPVKGPDGRPMNQFHHSSAVFVGLK